jgi:hypothetical protein
MSVISAELISVGTAEGCDLWIWRLLLGSRYQNDAVFIGLKPKRSQPAAAPTGLLLLQFVGLGWGKLNRRQQNAPASLDAGA